MQFTIQDFTSTLKDVDKREILQPMVDTACHTILGAGKTNIHVLSAMMVEESPSPITTYLTISGLAYFCMRLIRRTLLDLYSAVKLKKLKTITEQNMTTIAKNLTTSILSMVDEKTQRKLKSHYFIDYPNLLQGIRAKGFRWVANEERTTWFPSKEGSPLLPPTIIYQCPSFNPAKKWARTHMMQPAAGDIPGDLPAADANQNQDDPGGNDDEHQPILPPVVIGPNMPAAPNAQRGQCEVGYADRDTFQCPPSHNVCPDPRHGCVPNFYVGDNLDQGQWPFAIDAQGSDFRPLRDPRLKCECRAPPYGPPPPPSRPMVNAARTLGQRFATAFGARVQVGVAGHRRALRVKDVWVPGIAQTKNQPGYYGYFEGVPKCGMYGCTPMRMGATDICPKNSPVVNFCGKPENESLYYGHDGTGIALWKEHNCADFNNSLSLDGDWCAIRSNQECTSIKKQDLCSMAYTIADDKQIDEWNKTPILVRNGRKLVKGDALKCQWEGGKCNAPLPQNGNEWKKWKETMGVINVKGLVPQRVCPACPAGTCRVNIPGKHATNIHPLRCAVNGKCPSNYTKI